MEINPRWTDGGNHRHQLSEPKLSLASLCLTSPNRHATTSPVDLTRRNELEVVSLGHAEAIAYLSLDFRVVKASRAFCETIGTPTIAGCNLGSMIAPQERNRLSQIQSHYLCEKQAYEPDHLPPILSLEPLAISELRFGIETIASLPFQRWGQVVFAGAGKDVRVLSVDLCLIKQSSFYFLALRVDTSPPRRHTV